MMSPKRQLDEKLRVFESGRRKNKMFLRALIPTIITWSALGLTYAVLRPSTADDLVWVSGMLALLALQIMAAWIQSED
jgi:hypothetical protein